MKNIKLAIIGYGHVGQSVLADIARVVDFIDDYFFDVSIILEDNSEGIKDKKESINWSNQNTKNANFQVYNNIHEIEKHLHNAQLVLSLFSKLKPKDLAGEKSPRNLETTANIPISIKYLSMLSGDSEWIGVTNMMDVVCTETANCNHAKKVTGFGLKLDDIRKASVIQKEWSEDIDSKSIKIYGLHGSPIILLDDIIANPCEMNITNYFWKGMELFNYIHQIPSVIMKSLGYLPDISIAKEITNLTLEKLGLLDKIRKNSSEPPSNYESRPVKTSHVLDIYHHGLDDLKSFDNNFISNADSFDNRLKILETEREYIFAGGDMSEINMGKLSKTSRALASLGAYYLLEAHLVPLEK